MAEELIPLNNACNDLVGSENSIEVRNIFIQKNIIKEIKTTDLLI